MIEFVIAFTIPAAALGTYTAVRAGVAYWLERRTIRRRLREIGMM